MAVTWNAGFELTPAGSDSPSQGDDRIRELKEAVRERLNKEHSMNPLSGAASEDGWHKAGSAMCYVGATVPTTRPDGATALDADDDGRLWISSDDFNIRAYRHAAGATAADRWEVVSGAGGAGENFIQNDLTKPGIAGVTENGANSLEWDATATSLLNVGALKVDFLSTGTGRYMDVALNELDPNNVNQPWLVKFSYLLSNNADDLVSVYIYDGTVEIPLAISALPYAGGTLQNVAAAVLPTTVLTDVKLRFKFKDSTAITFYLADVSVGPYSPPSGGAIGATQTYSLTVDAVTTPPSTGTIVENVATFAYRGDKVMLTYRYKQSTAGSAGSGTYLFPLPNGDSIDLAKHPVDSIIGTFKVGNAVGETAAENYIGHLYVYDATRMYAAIVVPTSSGNTLTLVGSAAAGSSLSQANAHYSFTAEFKRANASATINLATDFQEFAFNTQATINTNDTTSFGYGEGGAALLAHTALTYMDVQFKRDIQNTDRIILEFRDKVSKAWFDIATAGSEATIWTYGSLSGGGATHGSAIRQVASNKVRVIFGRYGGVTGAGTSTAWATLLGYADTVDRWRVRKISNGNMAEIPPVVSCITASTATAVSGGPLIWASVEEDTHNALNLSTGVYTVPMDGLYEYGTGYIASATSELEIYTGYKNGVSVAVIARDTGAASQVRFGAPIKIRCKRGDTLEIRHSVAGTRSYTAARVSFVRVGS